MKYLFPNMPNRLNPNSAYFDVLDKDKNWIAEIKRNGWRCLAEKDGQIILWTRHKTTINEPLSGIREALRGLPDKTMLDGELIHTRRVKGIPDRLYLFDILIFKGDSLINEPLRKRRGILEIVYKEYLLACKDIELARQINIGKKILYEKSIGNTLDEGIVLKHLDSKYLISERDCLRNHYWIKVKKIEKHIFIQPTPKQQPKKPDRRPKNIIGWIKKKGGINYAKEFWSGELDIAIENNPNLKTVIFKKNGKGLTLDELAMMAQAEGWLEEATPQALLDAINDKKLRVDIEEKIVIQEIQIKTKEKEINDWIKEVSKNV